MVIRFTVYGHPETAGSKRSFVPLDRKTKEPFRRRNGGIVVSTVDDNPKGKPWKGVVAFAARQAYKGELLRGPLAVTMRFYRPRPQGHFSKSGLSKLGRESPFPISKPDVLKLARAAEDACTEIIWSDDALIVEEHLFKDWGEPARLEIEITQIPVATDHPVDVATSLLGIVGADVDPQRVQDARDVCDERPPFLR